MDQTLVSMDNITKDFPGVRALDGCRFELRKGEVHALVGENGAGKSTLMKVLTGVYRKDAGRIVYDGNEVDIPDTRTAQKLGISIIHQELNLAKDLTAAQNIFLGREPRRGLMLDERKLNEQAARLFERLGIELDPRVKIAELTVANQQMVEIAKALSFDAKVLIMDEPTAALSEAEIGSLFRIIGQLKAEGVGIVYISHRMDELKKITDRITVMRDGAYIDTVATAETPIERIIAMMVGRELYHASGPAQTGKNGEIVLEVRHLNRGKQLKDVGFTLRKGEIVGFAGLVGAGRTEVARAIFGADPIDSGDIYVHGRKVRIRNPYDAVREGIGYLSEDRKQFGCLVDMDVKTNIALPSMRSFVGGLGWMNDRRIGDVSAQIVERLCVKTPGTGQLVKFLSGGNQQKVIIGKWLVRDCDIFIFDEPTRGIDVGAKGEIYELLDELAAQGKAILMISSELPEVLRLSHRIIVMCEGAITGELRREEATQENIMQYATRRIG
ncbi:D-ribose transporter ATP-binding protein [Gordoniibacillus kamchatkensis]|uniref:D-ribose transporter ATP-binding protein n=1 Tax=Gordoniibacillus kamchatkensis TaxID=1590651 RepID=A0ABR5AKJ5_9BACL|nr:sugar ABC transporter ATP-binding protein [Paenibacillus sp. VKM B-2647]KIL41298.1 D-ribose transporter ATP-binding protein [Paenibacillus sp. VKM B-2647]